MKNKNFTHGFVETCVSSGLGLPKIKLLLSKQASIDIFDSDDFKKGFSSVVGERRLNSMTQLEKASCVESLYRQVSD